MTDLTNIKGLIWDMDGTLYRYSDLFKTACNHAAARAAIQVRPEYHYEYAFEQCVLSEKQHGFSLYWFHQETKIPFDDMHFIYHDSIDEKVIDKNHQMVELLQGITIPSLLLTNASRGWATRVLAHLGMGSVFPDDKVLALEDFGFQPKGRSTAGFELAVQRLGLPANDILMVEDLPRNLQRAKEIGLKTALVHHGVVPDDRSHIDYLFQDGIALVKAL